MCDSKRDPRLVTSTPPKTSMMQTRRVFHMLRFPPCYVTPKYLVWWLVSTVRAPGSYFLNRVQLDCRWWVLYMRRILYKSGACAPVRVLYCSGGPIRSVHFSPSAPAVQLTRGGGHCTLQARGFLDKSAPQYLTVTRYGKGTMSPGKSLVR